MIKRNYLLIFFLFYVSSSFSQDKQNESTTNKEWSFSYNFTSIVRKNYQYFFSERKRVSPSSNQFFSIAPEVKFCDFFSCRFPLAVGLQHVKNGTLAQGRYEGVNFGYHAIWEAAYPYDANKEPYYNSITNYTDYYQTIPGHGNYPVYKSRPLDLAWQIGICPKIYVGGSSEICNPYLAVSLNLNQFDRYRIDCYNTMIQGDDYWKFTQQKMYAFRNPFFVVRTEYLLGLDFRFGTRFHIDCQGGFSPAVKKDFKTAADRIYYSYNGGENILIDEILTGDINLIGYFFGNVLLRYSF